MKLLSLSLITLMSFSTYAADGKMDEAMKKKMQDFSTPSEAHKMLAQYAGKWSFVTKFWMPDGKVEETKGSATMKMILGGRFLQQEMSGTSMGQPFTGIGITGYDNLKKVYDNVWLDSMSTAIMNAKGNYDSSTKTLSETGEFTCPMEDDNTADFRSVWEFKDKNNMVFTMYTKANGASETKMMEMTYKRK